MPLARGARIGPYEIAGPLGVGGMGEVYRATDSILKREVALKVLPSALAADAERLSRLQREAEVLASLNHPNIAAIFGIEQAPTFTALVLELVEGHTLAYRIAEGRLPLNEALPIARQIAEALEAAHERGVVHRDLKPANIKLRPDGLIKVLDFGLAKALGTVSVPGIDHSAIPTIRAQATHTGMLLGTPAYMPPEQAEGKSVDKVADIWAFGAVLYEMITGRRAFEGENISTILAKVIEREPDWSALPAMTPFAIRQLLHRCLEKDRRRRLRDIGEARIAIEDEMTGRRTGAPVEGSVASRRLSRGLLIAISAAALCVAAAFALVAFTRVFTEPPVTDPTQTVHFTIVPPPAQALSINGLDRDLTISPDGKFVVYVGGAARQLIVRSLDRLDAMPLTGTEGARMPFVSSDSRWIGFFVGESNELKKIPISGGAAVTLCKFQQGPRGASWAADDTLVFATSDVATGLLRVAGAGGDPEVLTRADPNQGQRDHLFPSMLPGGDAVLFTIVQSGSIDTAQIAVLDLRTGERSTLITGGSHPQYVEASTDSGMPGYIVYSANGTLRAVRFDPVTRQLRGDPAPVVEHVMSMASGAAQFSVSRRGMLVYVPGGGQVGTGRSLVWLTRQGQEEPLKAPARAYTHPRLSPDDSRVALDVFDQEQDIWIWDLKRESMTRFTLDPGLDIYPTWTQDSRRIIFSSTRSGEPNLYWQPADGTGAVAPLTTGSGSQNPYSVTADGTRLALSERATNQGADLNLLRLDRPDEPHTRLVNTSFEEINAEFSTDGRWVAYQSNESGRNEIYVRPFPDVDGGRWQVSTSGGSQPLWARNGRELFFLDGDNNLMSVAVPRSGSFTPGNPTKILGTLAARYFTAGPGRTYDVSRDGQQFLMIRAGVTADLTSPTTSTNIVVVANWLEELKQLVPVR